VAGVAFIVGIGLTVTVTVVDEEQAPVVAVNVKVVVCTVPVVFVSVPVIVAPVPVAAIPVRLTVLSLVQLKVVPITALGFVIVIVPIGEAEHRV